MDKKPKFLLVAPYLPRFDRNSGDFRLFQIIGMIAKSHEITYIAAGDTGENIEDDRRYLSALRDLNITVHSKDASFLGLLLKNRYDVAMLEFYYVAEHYLPRIRMVRPRCPVIVDTVDVHYRRAFTKHDVTKCDTDLYAAEKIKKNELAVYRNADMVITVTEEDAEILKSDCGSLNTRVVPNIHEINAVRVRNENLNLLFVGGFSHDPNVDAVQWLCADIFPLIREALPGVTLTIAGSNPPEAIRQFQSNAIEVTGFVPSLAQYYRKSLLSVAPLRYGSGMKGKVGEAMAHGLPVVTTTIGAQGMGLIHGFDSMISDNAEGFAAAVIELIRDRKLYESVRAKAMEKIRETSSPEIVERKIRLLLSELAAAGAAPMRLGQKFEFLRKYVVGRLG